jgi:hypothetical protein
VILDKIKKEARFVGDCWYESLGELLLKKWVL